MLRLSCAQLFTLSVCALRIAALCVRSCVWSAGLGNRRQWNLNYILPYLASFSLVLWSCALSALWIRVLCTPPWPHLWINNARDLLFEKRALRLNNMQPSAPPIFFLHVYIPASGVILSFFISHLIMIQKKNLFTGPYEQSEKNERGDIINHEC